MPTDIWGPIDQKAWRRIPHISGRMATEADVKQGHAVFYLKNYEHFGGGIHEMSLPCRATWTKPESQERIDGVIIQSERGESSMVLIGFRPFAGGNVVATLPEFVIWKEVNESSL